MIKTHDNAEMTMHVPSSGETDFKQEWYSKGIYHLNYQSNVKTT